MMSEGHEPLFVAADAGLDELLEHDVEQGLSGEVADEEGAGAALTAEGAGAQVAFVVPVEGDAEVLHVNEGPSGGAAHYFDSVLVAQEVTALHRVVGVVFPVIAPVGEGRVDAALRRVGVAADGVNFTDNRRAGAVGAGRDGCPHTGKSGADYQDIMLQHIAPIPPGCS